MKNFKYLLYLIIPLMVIIFSNCKEDNPIEPKNNDLPTYENTGEIGNQGGTITASTSNTTINGAYISIPQGALDENVVISIETAPQETNFYGNTDGIFVKMKPEGIQFNKNVEIGIPYKKQNLADLSTIPDVYYYDSNTNKWIKVNTIGIDAEKKLVIAEVNHFTVFTAELFNISIDVNFYRTYDNEVAISFELLTDIADIVPVPYSQYWSSVQEMLEDDNYGYGNTVDLEYVVKFYEIGKLDEAETRPVVYSATKNTPTTYQVYAVDVDNTTPIYSSNNTTLTDIEVVKELLSGKPGLVKFRTPSGIKNESYYAIDFNFSINVTDQTFSFSTASDPIKASDMLNASSYDNNENGVIDDFDHLVSPNFILPNIPKNPNPAHKTTISGTDVTLSWECTHPENNSLEYIVVVVSGGQTIYSSGFEVETIPEIELTGLQQNSQFSWQVYALNSGNGHISYSRWGPKWIFNTPAAPSVPNAPVLSSPANNAQSQPVNITLSWNQSTGADNYRLQVADNNSFNNPFFDQSIGNVTEMLISGLESGTEYHWRVNASNTIGTSPWSNTRRFTTVSSTTPPTVTTTSITNITANSASGGGNVTADGGATVSARGVCWSISQNPTTSDNKTTDGSGTGSFTSSLTGLSPNTTYYVRAYATNSAGTSYGSQVSFTTSTGGGGGEPCPGIEKVYYEGGPNSDGGGAYYNTVQIGDQCWLKENLNYETANSWCYDNNTGNCETYGRLYTWQAAMNGSTTQGTKGICPDGWHIPTRAEFETLIASVNNDGNALKAIGQNGTNTSGFSALLAGNRSSNGNFNALGVGTGFFSSTEYSSSDAYHLSLSYPISNISFRDHAKDWGFSVRCVQD